MKNVLLFVILSVWGFGSLAQNFSADEYINFRESVDDISKTELEALYSRSANFYLKGFEPEISVYDISYLDTVITKLGLTADELSLIKQNRFMVTERLSYQSFGQAFHSVYNYDLPVFITTDAVLHALHASYDQILKATERGVMAGNLEEFLKSLYDNFGMLTDKYGDIEKLADGLKDADLYTTIAYSLIVNELQTAHIADNEVVRAVWEAISSEKLVSMPLFTFPERERKLDFSQFTIRGHYVYTEEDKYMGLKSLEPYFRAMMWLGRTDFFLTSLAANPWESPYEDFEIQRMHYGAFMVNELMHSSGKIEQFRLNEQIINYFVGESDNITPNEFLSVLNSQGITDAEQLTDTVVFNNLRDALNSDSGLGQKILSDFFFMDPNSDEPGELPVSFRLSGQRFIIDSYVLGNVVFDRIVYKGKKVMRMMPDPLDAVFALGNNDALPLLSDEFEVYPYADQLANLRYLADQKSDDFWSGSLYNVWLNSIRKLNPPGDESSLPLFMQTSAWHQEKINTQLASWSQLRHDNLLYAKQSYTGATGCSFPHSYIEPYPEFYRNLKQFADDAGSFFDELAVSDVYVDQVIRFYSNFAGVMEKLGILAEKELSGAEFTGDEKDWLKTMLFADGGSGVPPYSGWYVELFFDVWDASEGDFTVVDVHTQPTDAAGNVVGKVLHTGTGMINLGVFVAENPLDASEQMAYVGPVMSYYEKITNNFERLTDQQWEDFLWKGELPERPDWTNIYLAGAKGEAASLGAEIPSQLSTGTGEVSEVENNLIVFPNPVSDRVNLICSGEYEGDIDVSIINISGIIVKKASYTVTIGNNHMCLSVADLPEGVYVVRAVTDDYYVESEKITKE